MFVFAQFRWILARIFVMLALVWERAVPVLFPALLFPALYIALALFGAWERVGDPWRLIALLLGTALTVYFLRLGLRGFIWPDCEARARRLEADAKLSGRPLEILSDRAAQGHNKEAAQLWLAQQERARGDLKQIRPRKPRAALARRDVYGLRAGAFLLLFAALVLAGPRGGVRLDEAFAPRIIGNATPSAKVEAWISGPGYALLAPKFLKNGKDDDFEVLEGSHFHLKVSGVQKKPVLLMQNMGTKQRWKMHRIGPQSFDLEVPIEASGVLALKRPLLQVWHVRVRADRFPKILFTKTPEGNLSDALAFSYAARDDVGVASVDLQLALADGSAEPERTALDLPGLNIKSFSEKSSLDFTRHRWAGQAVKIVLIVRDGAGHEGVTRPAFLTLPEKLFVNPMAKAIAEQRLLLVRGATPYAPMPKRPVLGAQDARARPKFFEDKPAERLERAPARVRRSAAMMRASLRAPEMFFDDPLVYVGLRYAAENLRLARRRDDFKALDKELWALALWAEGGALADARAALKAAERVLRRALTRGASADELARLMHNYERAVKRYMEALAEEALRRGGRAKGENGNGPAMDSSALQDMLDALKALSETGARGDARKLLQALSELLQNLQMQLSGGGGSGDDAAAKAMRKALEELGDITAEQREILDEMFRQQQGSSQPGDGLASEQEGLGGQLRALAQGQGEEGQAGAAGKLGESADDMDRAAGALREDDVDGALQAGKDALSVLREGSEVLASDLFAHIAEQNGEGDEERDPFGRPTRGGGSQSANGTSVPDVINAERAREILQLLRDRAAQQGRSDDELEYLDRLLERF